MKTILVVPVKGGALQKSRLSAVLGPAERQDIAMRMASHVLAKAARAVGPDNVFLLSSRPLPGMTGTWREDQLRGLNAELTAFREDRLDDLFVIVSADLPFVKAEDIEQLIAIAAAGKIALAPNRDGSGTNAIATPAGESFGFSFGEQSLARHQLAAGDRAELMQRRGLAFDIDTPEDLSAAMSEGFNVAL